MSVSKYGISQKKIKSTHLVAKSATADKINILVHKKLVLALAYGLEFTTTM